MTTIKLYLIRTNAYDMIVADDGETRYYAEAYDSQQGFWDEAIGAGQTTADFDEEIAAAQYLTTYADNLRYNCTEWESTEQTVDELAEDAEILASLAE